jgi:hypothetical protein
MSVFEGHRMRFLQELSNLVEAVGLKLSPGVMADGGGAERS